MSSDKQEESSSRVEEEKKETQSEEEAAKEPETPPPPPATMTEKLEKPKTVDWPLRDIEEPHDNDVLYGRGGGTNHHPGNKRYRKMVEDRKLDYVNSKRLDKPLVALEIIREWRAQDPPGRFLKLDEKTGLWHDVGDKNARLKTSQALREKAPLIRKQQEEEHDAQRRAEDGEDESEDDSESGIKTTRFAEGTNLENGSLTKAVLARDHSLGREYLDEGEAVTLDGFSWQDPFQSGSSRATSGGPPGPPPPHGYPYHRYPNAGNLGPPPPPPPPGAYAHMAGDERHMRYASGRYESWGSMPPGPPPPMGYPYSPQPGPGWNHRDHSLSHNPLAHANVGQPAPRAPFDSRNGSWGPPPPGYPYYQGPPPGSHGPPPPPPAYPPPPIQQSRSHEYPSPSHTPTAPSPPYTVDPAVASAWSGQDALEIAKSWSQGSSEDLERYRPSEAPRSPGKESTAMRPDIVKRATSNQNETIETKPDLVGPSVKRAALNRDNSLASNRLKEKYVPGFKKKAGPFNAEHEVRQLSANFEQSTLVENGKPTYLTASQRMSTVDQIAMDLMVKPVSLTLESRSSTIDALALDLEDDPVLARPGMAERSRTMEEVFNELRAGVPKPNSLTMQDRLTTKDLMDMVNEPIGEDDELFDAASDRPLSVSRDTSIGQEWVEGV